MEGGYPLKKHDSPLDIASKASIEQASSEAKFCLFQEAGG